MEIAVFGLGYVGCVSAACLARDGHRVIGVDINPQKIELIDSGNSPIIEPGLEELIQTGVAAGSIKAIMDTKLAVKNAQIAMICVGTPSQSNGSLDLSYVERVCNDIGLALASKEEFTVVVLRSTVIPGYAQERLLPILESISGKSVGLDFGFCVNPEFLREGSAIHDFDYPPYTIIGHSDEPSGDILAQIYQHLNAPLYRLPLGAAEMVKYASNAFHALKVVFANEIGNVCKAYGIDSHQVMEIFVQDDKLNLSPAYLKPGFAFGGSCLGKDTRALLYAARQRDIQMPMLEAVLPSNQLQIQKVVDLILSEQKQSVCLIGLSFKPQTDDLRESPAVELAERLLGKGINLTIYDREVTLSRLHGSNRAFIDMIIPHIGSLVQSSLEKAVKSSELIVITKQMDPVDLERLVTLLGPDQVIIDLVRLKGDFPRNLDRKYHGFSW